MRVLALITDAFGGYGGIAQYNRDFLSALSASPGVRNVVALPRLGRAAPGEIPPKILQLLPQESRARYVWSACHLAMRNGPFDLIFCGHINAAPLSACLGKALTVPVWLQTHGLDAWEMPSWPVRAAVEHSALITAVSRYTRRRLLEWANIDPSRLRVLPNTVRPIFSPGPASGEIVRKYGLSSRNIILTVSRIAKADRYKGHARVIEALPALLKKYPGAAYVIVGDGDGRQDLENLVSRHGLQSSVQFLGRISDDDVVALYRSSSVFIMPSTKEGFGIVFSEAAATGLCVIGGDRDGSADALADGVIGRLIDPESRLEIDEALQEALDGLQENIPLEVARFSFPNFAAHVDELIRSFNR